MRFPWTVFEGLQSVEEELEVFYVSQVDLPVKWLGGHASWGLQRVGKSDL